MVVLASSASRGCCRLSGMSPALAVLSDDPWWGYTRTRLKSEKATASAADAITPLAAEEVLLKGVKETARLFNDPQEGFIVHLLQCPQRTPGAEECPSN